MRLAEALSGHHSGFGEFLKPHNEPGKQDRLGTDNRSQVSRARALASRAQLVEVTESSLKLALYST